jgi:uncharacterized protein (DUF305 family)
MDHRLRPLLALLALLALLGLPGVASASAPAPTNAEARFEVDFLRETVDHHFMALEMGELCVEKATDERLQAVCADIVAAQAGEIEDMRGFLRDWYSTDEQPSTTKRDERDMEELEEAEPGEEFDVLVSEMFIEHHRVQIRRSELCLRRAFHEELVDLCERQIETQSAEIEVFEAVIESYRES